MLLEQWNNKTKQTIQLWGIHLDHLVVVHHLQSREHDNNFHFADAFVTEHACNLCARFPISQSATFSQRQVIQQSCFWKNCGKYVSLLPLLTGSAMSFCQIAMWSGCLEVRFQIVAKRNASKAWFVGWFVLVGTSSSLWAKNTEYELRVIAHKIKNIFPRRYIK